MPPPTEILNQTSGPLLYLSTLLRTRGESDDLHRARSLQLRDARRELVAGARPAALRCRRDRAEHRDALLGDRFASVRGGRPRMPPLPRDRDAALPLAA